MQGVKIFAKLLNNETALLHLFDNYYVQCTLERCHFTQSTGRNQQIWPLIFRPKVIEHNFLILRHVDE